MKRPAIGFQKIFAEGARVGKRARWDGKPMRCPKAGEWFISGAIPEAYKAANDLNTEYFIAVICND